MQQGRWVPQNRFGVIKVSCISRTACPLSSSPGFPDQQCATFLPLSHGPVLHLGNMAVCPAELLPEQHMDNTNASFHTPELWSKGSFAAWLQGIVHFVFHMQLNDSPQAHCRAGGALGSSS